MSSYTHTQEVNWHSPVLFFFLNLFFAPVATLFTRFLRQNFKVALVSSLEHIVFFSSLRHFFSGISQRQKVKYADWPQSCEAAESFPGSSGFVVQNRPKLCNSRAYQGAPPPCSVRKYSSTQH